MNGKYTRILATSAGILLIVYLLYQTVFTSLSSIKTETAIAYTAEETISAEGYIIRDETIITSDDAKGGVLNYEIADGNRVAKGGKVAGVYKSERDVEIKAQIAELDNQISKLSVVCNMDMSNVTDLSRIDNQIKTGLIDLLDIVDGGDYSSLSAAADEYLTLLNKRLVAIGAETNFSARLATLQSRKAELEAQLGTAIDITSESAGYFVSSIDGYENVLGTDSVKTLTKEQLESIKPEDTKTENVIGKTVDSVDWYIATVLSFEDSLKFTEGQALRIRVPLQTATELPVTVEKINRDAASSETVIVFKCGYMNGELSLIRTQPLTIIVSSSEGLYVPNDARRIVDDQIGVFVKTGNAIKFKPIEVIYNGTGFVICKKDGELRLYDEVIVKGNDLYDGKIVN
ncbi:MAG: hypothetical protein IIY18_01225 [Clostridia bacterium]|nr:hypothetical protein [Clostridia bacterium]